MCFLKSVRYPVCYEAGDTPLPKTARDRVEVFVRPVEHSDVSTSNLVTTYDVDTDHREFPCANADFVCCVLREKFSFSKSGIVNSARTYVAVVRTKSRSLRTRDAQARFFITVYRRIGTWKL